MVDISFEIKGKAIEPDGMKDVLDILFLEHIRQKIQNCLEPVRCEKHGHEPRVMVKGRDVDNLTFEVSGCCKDIIQKAQEKIK